MPNPPLNPDQPTWHAIGFSSAAAYHIHCSNHPNFDPYQWLQEHGPVQSWPPPPSAAPSLIVHAPLSHVINTSGAGITLDELNSLEAEVAAERARRRGKNSKNHNQTILRTWGMCDVSGEVGLEIECEGENLLVKLLSYWRVLEDHSLRSYKGHKPYEYVLRAPLPRDELPTALDYLKERMKKNSSNPVDSPRTSVHVHLNVQELTIEEVYRIVILYLIVEDLLVEYAGAERVGNLFCLRAKDASHFLTILEESARNDSYAPLGDESLRYTSCNVASLSKFGSLEFRALRGTVDPKIILEWVDILRSIRDVALTRFKSPTDIVQVFEREGPIEFLKLVFPIKAHYDLFKLKPGLRELLWTNLRGVRDVVYASKWEKDAPGAVRAKPKKVKDFIPVELDEDNDEDDDDE